MVGVRAIKNHFIQSVVWRGKKLTAENFFVLLLCRLKSFSTLSSFDIFYYSTLNLRPLVFLRPVRIGSVVYKTPAPITDHKRRLLALKFIFQSVRDSRGSVAVERVATILNAIYFASKNLASDRKFAWYREAMENRSFVYRVR